MGVQRIFAKRRRAYRVEGDRVTAMETSWGHKITVSYGGARVVSAISSDGRCVRYSYDDENRLVQVDGPDGSRRYEWDDTLITTVVDACGNAECINSYDGRGRITSQQAANGRTVHFRYLPGASPPPAMRMAPMPIPGYVMLTVAPQVWSTPMVARFR